MTINRRVVPIEPYTFVLWSDQCQECAAAIFVTQVRAAGLPVKVVGVGAFNAAGEHGLSLVPDLLLAEALPLAQMACCVVIPCQASHLRRLLDDPRLQFFLAEAKTNGALLVVHPTLVGGTLVAYDALGDLQAYPPDEQLVPFAQELARWVVG